jgi:hypothetical protein
MMIMDTKEDTPMTKKDVKKSVAAHVQLPSEVNYALFYEIMETLEGVQKVEKKKFTPERMAKEVYGVVFLNFHLLYWEEKTERVRLEQQAIERVGQIDKLERENQKLRQEVELYKRGGVQEKSLEQYKKEIQEIGMDTTSRDL